MSQGSVSGIGFVTSGLSLIVKPGIKRYVMVPLLINIIVFSLFAWYGYTQFDQFMEWLLPEVDPDAWAITVWIHTLFSSLLWILFSIAYLFLVFSTFTIVANLIASPFNAVLANKVEQHLRGGKFKPLREGDESFAQSIGMELRKILYFITWAIPFLILFLIPVVNVIAPVTWFLFSAWFLALEYSEFSMSNHNITFDEQRQRLGKKRFMSLSFGSGLTLLMMVPFVNFLAMPVGVAGATKMWVDSLSKD